MLRSIVLTLVALLCIISSALAQAPPIPLPEPEGGAVSFTVKKMDSPEQVFGGQRGCKLSGFTADGKAMVLFANHVLSGDGKNAIFLVSAASGNVLDIFNEVDEAEGGIAYDPRSKMIAYSKKGRSIVLLDMEKKSKRECVKEVTKKKDVKVLNLIYSQDGSMLFGRLSDGTIHVWEAANGKPVTTFTDPEGFTCYALSPDNTVLAAGSPDHTVKLWDVKAGKSLPSLEGYGDGESILQVEFSPDGKYLASASQEGPDSGRAMLYSTATWKRERIIVPQPSSVPACYLERIGGIRFAPDSKLLAAYSRYVSESGMDKAWIITVWEVKTGALLTRDTGCCGRKGIPVQCYDGYSDELSYLVTDLAFSPDARIMVAMLLGDPYEFSVTLRLWRVNAETGPAAPEAK